MVINKLELYEHNIFNNVDVVFSESSKSKNYKTIIIGPNGTGKSSFLGLISDILSIELSHDKEKSLKKFETKYNLTIESEGKKHKISNITKNKKIGIGKLLAITSTINDKFPYISKNSVRRSEKYIYLGLKTTSNNIFLSNIKESILILLFEIIKNEKKTASACEVLDELKFGSKIKFKVHKSRNFGKTKKFIKKDKSLMFSDSYDAKKLKEFLNSSYFDKNKSEILEILEQVSEKNGYQEEIELSHSSLPSRKNINFYLLRKLLDNNIVTVKELSLFSNKGYDINEASSGEFNILRTYLSIISHAEDNSIILIDEPEISLHPNWQIDFIPILDKAISKYTGCHTLIATHSHFMLTNANADDTSIVGLYPDSKTKRILVNPLPIEPYGWSPENILYQAFGITGNRNKYFEMDLRYIIDYFSEASLKKSDNEHHEFIKAVERIEKFKIEQNDPLYKLLNRALDEKQKLKERGK